MVLSYLEAGAGGDNVPREAAPGPDLEESVVGQSRGAEEATEEGDPPT